MRDDGNIAEESARVDLLRDESGAVMVEFLVVLPFLALVFCLVLLFTELNQFQIASQQLAAVQTWRRVGENESAGRPSDSVGIASTAMNAFLDSAAGIFGSGSVKNIKDAIGAVGNEATMRRAVFAYPNLRAMAYRGSSRQYGPGGRIAAHIIYSAPDLERVFEAIPNETPFNLERIEELSEEVYVAPWEVLGLPTRNFDDEMMDPRQLDDSNMLDDWQPGPSGYVAYRNASFLGPVRTIANGFVGAAEENERAADLLDYMEIPIPARVPMIHDPYSAYWATDNPREVQTFDRLRRVDRLTLLRMPFYGVPLGLQTIISGNPLFSAEFTGELLAGKNDLGWTVADAEQLFGFSPFSNDSANPRTSIQNALSKMGTLGHMTEAAQPFRKVDKDHRFRHDLIGEFRDPKYPESFFGVWYGSDYPSNPWSGWSRGPIIADGNLLAPVASDDVWEMVQ